MKGKLWIPGDNRTGTPPGEDAYVDYGKDNDGDGDGGARRHWYQQIFWGVNVRLDMKKGINRVFNRVSHTNGLYDMD